MFAGFTFGLGFYVTGFTFALGSIFLSVFRAVTGVTLGSSRTGGTFVVATKFLCSDLFKVSCTITFIKSSVSDSVHCRFTRGTSISLLNACFTSIIAFFTFFGIFIFIEFFDTIYTSICIFSSVGRTSITSCSIWTSFTFFETTKICIDFVSSVITRTLLSNWSCNSSFSCVTFLTVVWLITYTFFTCWVTQDTHCAGMSRV